VWESRCYSNGIPDEVSKKLQDSGRVPSYKAMAIAILNCDFNFHSLGFSRRESELSICVMKKQDEKQQALPL